MVVDETLPLGGKDRAVQIGYFHFLRTDTHDTTRGPVQVKTGSKRRTVCGGVVTVTAVKDEAWHCMAAWLSRLGCYRGLPGRPLARPSAKSINQNQTSTTAAALPCGERCK